MARLFVWSDAVVWIWPIDPTVTVLHSILAGNIMGDYGANRGAISVGHGGWWSRYQLWT